MPQPAALPGSAMDIMSDAKAAARSRLFNSNSTVVASDMPRDESRVRAHKPSSRFGAFNSSSTVFASDLSPDESRVRPPKTSSSVGASHSSTRDSTVRTREPKRQSSVDQSEASMGIRGSGLSSKSATRSRGAVPAASLTKVELGRPRFKSGFGALSPSPDDIAQQAQISELSEQVARLKRASADAKKAAASAEQKRLQLNALEASIRSSEAAAVPQRGPSAGASHRPFSARR